MCFFTLWKFYPKPNRGILCPTKTNYHLHLRNATRINNTKNLVCNQGFAGSVGYMVVYWVNRWFTDLYWRLNFGSKFIQKDPQDFRSLRVQAGDWPRHTNFERQIIVNKFVCTIQIRQHHIIMIFMLNIEAETTWPPFSRRHFEMHFLEWKYINYDCDFTEVCSQGSN